VAFGPGIDLLRAESPNRALVDSLIAQGVEFDVCMNTVETVERETGKNVNLNPKAVPVQVGVGRVLELTEKGYTLVRP
jgi:intracellular sulfur oxidation DsrE/DsrF family protein